MREQIKIPRGDALDLLEGEELAGFSHVTEQFEGNSRWARRMSLIIERDSDGKLFSAPFSYGATENQENDLFGGSSFVDDLNRMVTFSEVEKTQKTIVTYR